MKKLLTLGLLAATSVGLAACKKDKAIDGYFTAFSVSPDFTTLEQQANAPEGAIAFAKVSVTEGEVDDIVFDEIMPTNYWHTQYGNVFNSNAENVNNAVTMRQCLKKDVAVTKKVGTDTIPLTVEEFTTAVETANNRVFAKYVRIGEKIYEARVSENTEAAACLMTTKLVADNADDAPTSGKGYTLTGTAPNIVRQLTIEKFDGYFEVNADGTPKADATALKFTAENAEEIGKAITTNGIKIMHLEDNKFIEGYGQVANYSRKTITSLTIDNVATSKGGKTFAQEYSKLEFYILDNLKEVATADFGTFGKDNANNDKINAEAIGGSTLKFLPNYLILGQNALKATGVQF